MKSNRVQMKPLFMVILLVTLSTCGKQTVALPTETPIPYAVSPTPVPTSTFIAIIIVPSPSPLPTQPIVPVITPDAVQVEIWKEYQTELAKLVLSDSGAEFPFYKDALCEWDILGQSGEEVYVWADCFVPGTGGRGPAVIYLGTDGSIRDVKYAFPSSSRDVTISGLFPADVQAKIYTYFSSERPQEMGRHLIYRLTHPEEPPLIILSATPTP